jgi:YegS/Rv2252/BmrU family lipid kinase
MTQKTAAIIYNPASGRSRRREDSLKLMVEQLGRHSIKATVYATEAAGDAGRLAANAISNGDRIIIANGGDGTVNEVIQGMAGTDATLAIWAGGTANVAATDLGLPFAPKPLAEVIAAGKTKRVSLGVARLGGAGSNSRYFMMFAGIGLDASICRGVNTRLKRRTGELAFWVSGIQHLFRWQPEPFAIEIDGSRFDAAFAVIGKGKSYGGGFQITPHARLEDPWFEVFIVPPLKRNIGYAWDLVGSILIRRSRTRSSRVTGRRVVVNSATTPWVELDGEVVGTLPVQFDILPDALSVCVR